MKKAFQTIILILALVVIFELLYIFWPAKSEAPEYVYLNENANINQAAPAITSTTLLFGGDVMLSRHVYDKSKNDFCLPFNNIKSEFSKADISFLNLEAPFKETGPYDVPTGSFSFKADPKMILGLTESGIDVVSLATNHILNQGTAGLEYTKSLLLENKIDYCGAKNIAYLEKNGIKFAFLCYTYDPASSSIVSTLDQEDLKADLEEANKNSDIQIVSMHAGTEYVVNPTQIQKNFAHTAIDNGADLVIGHHPHETQIVEKYQEKYIFYSLGNMIFDQSWNDNAMKGLVLKAVFKNKNLDSLELLGVQLENNCCPRWMGEDEVKYFIERLGLESLKIK